MSLRKERPHLEEGTAVSNFIVERLIGRGGFSDVYKVIQQADRAFYALKMEPNTNKKRLLQKEIDTLIAISDFPYFPSIRKYGSFSTYSWCVMELLGPDLTSLRKKLETEVLPMSTLLRVSIEMLRCLECLHRCGYIHRDVKPSNFLIRPSRRTPLCMIDFGLARSYIDPVTHEIMPQREKPGRAGTTRYSSEHVLKGEDPTRRDDLYAWFYSVVELALGTLPWTSSSPIEDQILQRSVEHMTDYLKPLPKEFTAIYRLIHKLGPLDSPDYPMITAFICRAMKDKSCSWNDPFVWEILPKSTLRELSAIDLMPPLGEEPCVPLDLPSPSLDADQTQRRQRKKKGSCELI